MGVMRKSTFSKASVLENSPAQNPQGIKSSSFLLTGLKKNGSTGNATGALTES